MKNNKLIAWVKKNAPQALNTAGDLLPDSGVLGIVKNLIDGDPDLTIEDRKELNTMLLERFKVAAQDRDSARNRQVKLIQAGAKDWLFSVAGLTGLLAFVFLIYTVVYLTVPDQNREIFLHLIGIVEGVALMIFSYYFGGLARNGKDDK